jgi:multidrug resistance efflux pump
MPIDTELKQENTNISFLIELEQSVRRAETLQSLRFVIVNQTRSLIPFDQAILLSAPEKDGKPKVEAISGLPTIDSTSPFVHWVESMAVREYKTSEQQVRHSLEKNNLSQTDKDEWTGLSPPHVLWVPLIAPQRGLMGILWLARHEPWNNKDFILLDHVSLTYAHAFQVFKHPVSFPNFLRGFRKRPVMALIFGLLLTVMFIPVSLTAISPAEVVSSEPFVVVSPINGVVKKILVEPDQNVNQGQIVAMMDDTEHRNNVLVSEKALQVARAQLEKSELGAFADNRKKEGLAELKAQEDLHKVEFEFATEQLNNTVLRAENSGVAVVGRPEEWAGKPVKIGEKILQIADPHKVELEIMMSVKDSVLLTPGNKVLVFLDSAPMDPKEAEILYSEYEPRLTDLRNLAYRVTARFKDTDYYPRIGLRGVAKVYGQKVSLFYYLFRRPLTYLRQNLGF